MDPLRPVRTAPQPALPPPTATMDIITETTDDVDEPPERRPNSLDLVYTKALPPQLFARRESLLTRQLHSETEHSDDEHVLPQPTRALSTQSNCSAASTAELTSDDGRSVPSPGISPPLPATHLRSLLPVIEKPLDRKIQILGHEDMAARGLKDKTSEQTVEAGLGRRRCITFACVNKDATTTKPSPPPPTSHPEQPSSCPTDPPPPRKSMIQFVCPNRPSESKPAPGPNNVKRPISPPPPERKPVKAHRGSDSTVTHASPRSVRKSPMTSAPLPVIERIPERRAADSDESGTEAMRFHEFASSDDEPEEWIQESTVHRSRLTISDTLKKENVIRKACEEVEEEALEEEEDEDELDDSPLMDDEQDDEDEDDAEDDDESDDGFRSDDEEGFAESDDESDGEDSDYEWWKPGGRSTAATSVEQLDRLALPKKAEDDDDAASSLGSVSSANLSPRSSRHHFHKKARKAHRSARGVDIQRPDEPELPDSTDFVAGTLDEDRPLEEAFLNSLHDKEAAKHKARPQDIDPTFPTSDPEMDEEDDDDLVAAEDSDREDMMHGDMDEIDAGTAKPARSPRGSRRNTTAGRSPAPPRYQSPPPKRRPARSPAPTKRTGTRSPPRPRSPAPLSKKPTPESSQPTSPLPQSNHVSHITFGLPERFATHTASLPRPGGILDQLRTMYGNRESEEDDTNVAAHTDVPKRGAIDIVEGLARKRQRRKEKLYQKMCQKAAAKGEKPYKVKPGKGAERMREVGLELQRYKGKGEHIISV